MNTPGLCPNCGSERVRVYSAEFLGTARGRRYLCRDCRMVFKQVALSELIGETLVTVEQIAPLRASSVFPLRRLLEQFRLLLK
jgi:transposase-like protein